MLHRGNLGVRVRVRALQREATRLRGTVAPMLRPALVLLALAVGLGIVPLEPASASPSICNFPGTTARAVKVLGNGPAACALSVCRTIDRVTTKTVPCTSGPSCAGAFPYVEQWRAQAGAWAGLPACPAWTNASAWQ